MHGDRGRACAAPAHTARVPGAVSQGAGRSPASDSQRRGLLRAHGRHARPCRAYRLHQGTCPRPHRARGRSGHGSGHRTACPARRTARAGRRNTQGRVSGAVCGREVRAGHARLRVRGESLGAIRRYRRIDRGPFRCGRFNRGISRRKRGSGVHCIQFERRKPAIPRRNHDAGTAARRIEGFRHRQHS